MRRCLTLPIIPLLVLLHGCGCSDRSIEGEADADTSTVDVHEIVDPPVEPSEDPVVDIEPEEELVLCPPCDSETCDEWVTCIDGGPLPHLRPELPDTALHMFGVHWADEDISETGTLTLEITCTQVPVILSLSGCHSIHWVIEADPDVFIEHIYTSGWEEQIVSGVEGIPVERIADVCSLNPGGAESRALEEEIASRTDVRATTFSSTYFTTHFSLSHWCL
jgi:hypothetical protein